MKLQPDQVLLLHNIVFHYLSASDSVLFRAEAEDILYELKDKLLAFSDIEDVDGHVDDENHEDEDEDDEWSHLTDTVCADELTELPTLTVSCLNINGPGKLILFGGPPVSFDLEDKTGMIESGDGVEVITRRGKELVLISKDETWTFKVSKFPKEWTSLLEVNKSYRID